MTKKTREHLVALVDLAQDLTRMRDEHIQKEFNKTKTEVLNNVLNALRKGIATA